MNSTRQVALNRLIEYAKLKFHKEQSFIREPSLIIKPCGAFKEHHSFYAIMTRKFEDEIEYYQFDVRVDGILNNSDQCADLNVFYTTSSCQSHCIEKLDEVITEFVKELDDVKFDKLCGRMISKDCSDNPHDLNQILSDLWGMNTELNCCVCGDRTNTQTICGHTLCILCWASNNNAFYKENDNEDDHPKCPMCRQEVTFKNKDRFDDDERE